MSKEWAIARPESTLRDEEAERYRVFVRDLVVPCSIGIYPREKGLRRRVRVNAELVVAEAISGRDDFAEAVNYETVVAGIKGIAEQIAALSHQLTLRPGDVIATGTPAGVGAGRGDSGEFLKPGDEVKIEVQYCGTLVNRMVAAS